MMEALEPRRHSLPSTLTRAEMQTIPLGSTPFRISRLGLGAMRLSLDPRPGREEAKAVVRRAVELGITLVDTADVYALDDGDLGHNEGLVAEALREMGAAFGGGGGSPRVVVATKGGMTRPGGRWERNGRPEHLRSACEASLRALGVERIDLYQLHTPDPAVPFSESVGALARLREEGKVEAVGLSNVTVAQIREAAGLVPVASVQNGFGAMHALGGPSPVVEHCRREGITFLAYAPLGGRRGVEGLRATPPVVAAAERRGVTPAELALAWLLFQGPHVVPLPGPTRVESIESAVRATSVSLGPGDRRELERAFASLPGAPGALRRALRRLRER